eukprot:10223019-Alexandrium_andersonii.AAC.1
MSSCLPNSACEKSLDWDACLCTAASELQPAACDASHRSHGAGTRVWGGLCLAFSWELEECCTSVMDRIVQ